MAEPTGLIHQFQILDRDKTPHDYLVRLHPLDEGLGVVDKLLTLGLGAVIAMIFNSTDVPKNLSEMTEAEQAAIMLEVRRKIDVNSIGTQLTEGIERSGGLRAIAPLLLEFTHRDGVPMKVPANRDAAYAGNLVEATAALKEIEKRNGFFELLSTLIAR